MTKRSIAYIAVAAIVYSCASKQVAPPPAIAPSPEELKISQTIPREAVTSSVAVAPVTAAEGAMIAEGKVLYENNCARCHRLFGTKEFTREQWKPLVLSMQPKARLDDMETSKVIAYVTSESK